VRAHERVAEAGAGCSSSSSGGGGRVGEGVGGGGGVVGPTDAAVPHSRRTESEFHRW
jgi:hypothetical protein